VGRRHLGHLFHFLDFRVLDFLAHESALTEFYRVLPQI
jgi:hypothetical protein